MGGNGESGEPFEFKREMVDVTIPVGSSTKFLVEIRGCLDPNVFWFQNEAPITNSDRHVLLRDKSIFCVQIHQVKPSDEGNWVCRASSDTNNGPQKEICCNALLKLQIPQIYQAPRFITGLRGCLWDNGTLSLECEVTGVPTPILRWYRDGKPLDAGSALTIRAYSKESKSLIGLFACEAENCMGSNATFSRVYARNFANYLKQIGYLGGRMTRPLAGSNNSKPIKSNGGDNINKTASGSVITSATRSTPTTNTTSTLLGSDNNSKQREFRDNNNENNKSEEDSGIIVDDGTHHI